MAVQASGWGSKELSDEASRGTQEKGDIWNSLRRSGRCGLRAPCLWKLTLSESLHHPRAGLGEESDERVTKYGLQLEL